MPRFLNSARASNGQVASRIGSRHSNNGTASRIARSVFMGIVDGSVAQTAAPLYLTPVLLFAARTDLAVKLMNKWLARKALIGLEKQRAIGLADVSRNAYPFRSGRNIARRSCTTACGFS
jgi:hypothetical protein